VTARLPGPRVFGHGRPIAAGVWRAARQLPATDARPDGGADRISDQANAYAPFYLWRSSSALERFVLGAPLASLTVAFGRPSVEQALLCCFVPGADLSEVRELERERARERARDPAAQCVLVAVNPACWKLTRLVLRVDPVEAQHGADERLFEVARLSRPALAASSTTAARWVECARRPRTSAFGSRSSLIRPSASSSSNQRRRDEVRTSHHTNQDCAGSASAEDDVLRLPPVTP
jgi:hypothetical protein